MTASGPDRRATTVPEDHDPRVRSLDPGPDRRRRASRRCGSATGAATRCGAGPVAVTAGSTSRRRPARWSTVEVDFRDVDRLADEVAGLRRRACVAVAPPELTEAVVRPAARRAGVGEPPPRRSCMSAAAAASRPSGHRPPVPAARHGAVAAGRTRASRSRRPPREFGVSTEQLVEDLELLFVCGTPGTDARRPHRGGLGETGTSTSATPTTSPGRCDSASTRRSP